MKYGNKHHTIAASLLVSALTIIAQTGHANNKTTDKTSLALDVKLEGGKKIWSPAEAKVEAGKPLEITAHNSLGEPHGLTIPGYIEPQTIGAGETKKFLITPKKSGDLKVSCHLHPAHVPATLKIQ
ncbi:MAG: hypothetical protein EBU49_06880 [Proteobacteria bacterium]|nr:hypothetical protein [Pseudomonadota bacterium]